MRLLLLVISFLGWGASLQAQTPIAAVADTAPYLRYPFVPPLHVYKVPDSTLFTKADLKKKKPLLLIVFSPDCDHCQHETRDLTAQIEKFKNIQIVMVSWLPYAQVAQFYKDYHIADYPNITMAWDKSFLLPPYYQIKSLPFMALYDKKGDLINVFEGTVKLDKVLTAFD